MLSNLIKYLLLLSLCFISIIAKAACTVSPTTLINLNTSTTTISSARVYNGAFLPGSNTSSPALTCTGLVIQVLSGQKVYVTLQTTSQGLKNIDNSGDKISYQVFADAAYNHPFITSTPLDFGTLNLLNISLGSTSMTVPFYVRTIPGDIVRAGTYKEVLSFYWSYDICSGVLGLCLLGRETGTGTTLVTVTADIDKNCVINDAPDADLGSFSLIGQFNPITKSINLTCTKTEGYKMSFSDGNNRLSGSWRRLTDGAGHFLQYNIYQSNGTTVWDSSSKVSNSGTGLAQSIPYNVMVNPAQPELPAGVYTDQVSVIIEY